MTRSALLGALGALTLGAPASACITAHTSMSNCIFGGDYLAVQVWDDGRRVCDVSRGKHWAGPDTVWDWDEHSGCAPGYRVRATANGRAATVSAPNGYSASLRPTAHHNMRYQCGVLGAGINHEVPAWGTQFEACLSDHNGCRGGECHLCDYKTYCD